MQVMIRYRLLILFLLLFTFPIMAGAWSSREHNAIAVIAERNLTPAAKAKVSEILDGRSLMYYANWLDTYRKQMPVWYVGDSGELEKHSIPHIFYADDKLKVSADLQKGAVYHLDYAIRNLKNLETISDSLALVSMQYVIHLVGDIHCPCHIKYADRRDWGTDLSGSKGLGLFDLYFNGELQNGHWLWDKGLQDSAFPGDVEALVEAISIDDKTYIREIQNGNPIDWAQECAIRSQHVWDGLGSGSAIGDGYVEKYKALSQEMLMKAGYRLAAVLNFLFK